MNVVKFILVLFFSCAVFMVQAQSSSCDKLFASGVKLQQTMTIASQNQAITFFEKAKACYDSQAKKDLCDQQIIACRNIIKQLRPKSSGKEMVPTISHKDSLEGGLLTTPENTPEANEVELSIDCTYLRFKGKGGEFKKANVICNRSDWEVVDKPSWVSCTKNDNGELVIEVTKNPNNKEERSGIIKIECQGKSATLTIIQERFKQYLII
jgi:hypothetical protein